MAGTADEEEKAVREAEEVPAESGLRMVRTAEVV
jgi:hypothetical protein